MEAESHSPESNPEPRKMPGPNPKRARANAGTSRRSSGSQASQDLRIWWHTKPHGFGRQADIEAALKIQPGTFGHWMTGITFPPDPLCDQLYALAPELVCFSPEGRAAARLEHLQKKGLSRSAILKQSKWKKVTPDQLAECMADIRKAKTICGPDVIVCLGRRDNPCGRMLRFLKAKGAGAHLAKHGYISDAEYKDYWGYSHSTKLVCETLATQRREQAARDGRLIPGGNAAFLRAAKSFVRKGRKMPEESNLKKADRMRGTRNLERDTEILRLYLIERLPIGLRDDPLERDSVMRRVGFSAGRVHVILQRIFGIKVKQYIIFSRGELVTDLWSNGLCERFGPSRLELGEWLHLEKGVVKWLQQLGGKKKNRALTSGTAKPLVAGEGLFLEILANADASADDRADYLCAVVPDLAEKRDGASLAIGIARDLAGLKEVCAAAQTGDRRARIALAFVRSAVDWLLTLDNETRSLPVSELVREHFLPMELKTSPFLLRRAIERDGPAETKRGTIRGIIVNALRTKELEAKLAAPPKAQRSGGHPLGLRKRTQLRNEMAAISDIQRRRQKEVADEFFPDKSDAQERMNSTFDYFSHHRTEIERDKARLSGTPVEQLQAMYIRDRDELLKVLSKKPRKRRRRAI